MGLVAVRRPFGWPADAPEFVKSSIGEHEVAVHGPRQIADASCCEVVRRSFGRLRATHQVVLHEQDLGLGGVAHQVVEPGSSADTVTRRELARVGEHPARKMQHAIGIL